MLGHKHESVLLLPPAVLCEIPISHRPAGYQGSDWPGLITSLTDVIIKPDSFLRFSYNYYKQQQTENNKDW